MSSQIQANCTSCGLCAEVCPTGSVLPAEPHFLVNHDTCHDCLSCVEVCPVDAIRNPKAKVEKKK